MIKFYVDVFLLHSNYLSFVRPDQPDRISQILITQLENRTEVVSQVSL